MLRASVARGPVERDAAGHLDEEVAVGWRLPVHVPGACCVVDHHCAGRRDKFALAARALRERVTRAPASAALRLVDRRVNATEATLRGRGARTGMIDH